MKLALRENLRMQGVGYRFVNRLYQDDPISGKGALKISGRYGLGTKDSPIKLSDEIKIIYLASTHDLAFRETQKRAGSSELSNTYVLCEVKYFLPRSFIWDFRDPEIRNAFGINEDDLLADWENLNLQKRVAITQELGIEMYKAPYEAVALLVPSTEAQLSEEFNLVIFPDNLRKHGGNLEGYIEEELKQEIGKL